MESTIVVHRCEAKLASYQSSNIGRDVIILQKTENLISGITIVYPHCQTKGHIHPRREEHYYVLSGSGYILLDENRFEITVGDCINVPPISLHTVVNPTDEPLEFFWAAFPDEPKLLGKI